MIVSPPRPPRTPLFHMRAHETFIPQCGPLDADVYQIGLQNVHRPQHNPSVFLLDEKLYVNVRVLNDRGPFSTNYIARVEDDFTLTGVKQMKPKAASVVRGPIRTPLAMNFPHPEDLRVFTWRGRLWAIGCVHDGAPTPGWIKQALLELSPDGAEILQAHVINSDRHEKNWMPCVSGEELTLVYSTSPLITISVESSTKVPAASGIPQEMGCVRGGSQLIPYGDGWLAIVHQVFRPPRIAAGHNPLLGGWEPPVSDPIAGDAKVVYLHHFATFDKELTAVKLSEPFYFIYPQVEFCAGLVRQGDKFVASFGAGDKEAWLALFTSEAVAEAFAKNE